MMKKIIVLVTFITILMTGCGKAPTATEEKYIFESDMVTQNELEDCIKNAVETVWPEYKGQILWVDTLIDTSIDGPDVWIHFRTKEEWPDEDGLVVIDRYCTIPKSYFKI
jgi:hypothetical protein